MYFFFLKQQSTYCFPACHVPFFQFTSDPISLLLNYVHILYRLQINAAANLYCLARTFIKDWLIFIYLMINIKYPKQQQNISYFNRFYRQNYRKVNAVRNLSFLYYLLNFMFNISYRILFWNILCFIIILTINCFIIINLLILH